jgi:ABC-type nitrate/sulfonate/bicarbonate transport system substrate-binding protein
MACTRRLVSLLLWAILLVACEWPASPTPTAARAEPPSASAPLPAAAEPAASPPAPLPVRAAYTAVSGSMAPAWFAADGGFFAQQGLDVDLRFVATSTTLTPALISGEVQIAETGGGEIIQATLAGADLVLVGALVPVLVFSIYGDPALGRLDDLAGKRLAVSRYGSATDYAAQQALKRADLVPGRDVAVIQAGGVPEALAAVQAGGVEAAVVSPPTTLQARQAGLRELVDLGTQGVPYLQASVALGRGQLGEEPERARRFLRALVAGMDRARREPEWAKAVIGQYTRTQDAAVLDETYRAFVPRYPALPYVPAEAVEASLAEIAERDERARGADPARFYDNSLVAEIEARR